MAEWVGIGGYGVPLLEQVGTSELCADSVAQYNAWDVLFNDSTYYAGEGELLPITFYTVNAGDAMSASVVLANGECTFEITDSTEDWTFNLTTPSVQPTSEQNTAEWIVEDQPTGFPPQQSLMPNFGSVTFSDASATESGVQGTISSGPFSIEAVTNGSGLVSVPGALNASGTSFTDTYTGPT
jgi:hypothetical protein